MKIGSTRILCGAVIILALIDFIVYQLGSKNVSSEVRCIHILVSCAGILAAYALLRGLQSGQVEPIIRPVKFSLMGWIVGACGASFAIAVLLLTSDHYLHAENLGWSLVFHAFTIAVMAAVSEEIVFRGILLTLLIKLCSKARHGLVIAGGLECVLFTLSHYNEARVLAFYLSAFAWSVLLTISALRARALWLPIGLHVGYDTVQTIAAGVHMPVLAKMKGLLYVEPEYLVYDFGLTTMVALVFIVGLVRYKPGNYLPIMGSDHTTNRVV